MPFDGLPRNVRATPVPDPFFNSLLEEIEDPAELKVTFRLIWLLGQKRGTPRYIAGSDILNDATLLRGLKSLGGDPRDRIRQGLNLALTRGTILRHQDLSGNDVSGNAESIYLLNSEDNRRRLAAFKTPVEAMPGSGSYPEATDLPAAGTGGLPSIYDLYENNIGTIGPLMGQQLAEAEDRYPPQWIEEAFKIATFENKRSWSYISAILRRWAAQGKTELEIPEDQPPRTNPGIGVKGGATLWEEDGRKEDGRQHGEPGRHTEKDERSRQARSRQRR